MRNARTCPITGVLIVQVCQVSVTSHSLSSILDGNGVHCLCFTSFMVLAVMPLTPDYNVLWSCAVHPLRMMYWSTIHRSRTSSSNHFTCFPLDSRTSYSLPSNPITFTALLTPSSLSPVLFLLSVLHPELLLSISVLEGSGLVVVPLLPTRLSSVLPRSPPTIQAPSPPPPS
jgi:hypothetical protein